MRSIRFIVAYACALAFLGGPLATLSACDPAARKEAGSAISTLGPVLCNVLVPLVAGDNSQAGLVCDDAAKLLGGALMLAKSDSAPTDDGEEKAKTLTAAPAAKRSCKPIMLADVVPGRDPREFVCAGSGVTKAQIRAALGAR